MVRALFRRILASGIALLLGWPIFAQVGSVPKASDVVKWEVRQDETQSGGTGKTRLLFTADIKDGWSTYAMHSPAGRPLGIALDALPPGIETAGEPKQFGVVTAYDPNFESDVIYFRSDSRVEVGLRRTAATSAGKSAGTVEGRITFMACNDRICLPPTTTPFSVSVRIP